MFKPPVQSSRPLRIAVIGGRGIPSNYSGVERICEDLFVWFAEHGHKVTVYCRPNVLKEPTAMYKGVRLVRTPAPGGRNGETLSHSFFSLMHATFKGDVFDNGTPFDLFSMHTIAPNLFIPIAKLTGAPVVSHVHGLDHQREKWKGMGSRIIRLAEEVMVKFAHKVAVVNPSIQRYYREQFGLKTDLLPNGVHITPNGGGDPAMLAPLGLEPDKFFVSVGRLVPEKRLQDTIAAFAKVKTDFKLAIVGNAANTPEYLAELKKAAAGDPRVVFTGQQGGSTLESLFRGAYAYVSSSDLEGHPMSVLECMERGTCAILTDIDGHKPLFEPVPGYDFSFNPYDINKLTKLMQRAIDDPEHTEQIARAGQKHVRDTYGWPLLAMQTERLYQEIIHGDAHHSMLNRAALGVA